MSKRRVTFEYRLEDKEHKLTKFIATHPDTAEKWETVVKNPYKFDADFWHYDQFDGTVTRVSRRIAKENDAPEWVYSL